MIVILETILDKDQLQIVKFLLKDTKLQIKNQLLSTQILGHHKKMVEWTIIQYLFWELPQEIKRKTW